MAKTSSTEASLSRLVGVEGENIATLIKTGILGQYVF
jgi:hypothetical protein